MQIYSDLILLLHTRCIRYVRTYQANIMLDAKAVLDYYLEHEKWPERFYVYFQRNWTDICIPDKAGLINIEEGYKRDKRGVLVKFSLTDKGYKSNIITRSQLRKELLAPLESAA